MRLEKRENTFVGRMKKEFDFLGHHLLLEVWKFLRAQEGGSPKVLSGFASKTKAGATLSGLGQYVRRRQRWAAAGLRDLTSAQRSQQRNPK